MNKINKFLAAFMLFALTACEGSKEYNDGYIKYAPIEISEADKQLLLEKIESQEERYDSVDCMLTQVLSGWNYHTDAQSGTYHDTRSSLYYASDLLDCCEKKYEQRAFDIIDKVISLQDTDPNSPSCGVWPYFEEEPLATKKTPVDYNWADFNGVCLLDIYMDHHDRLPAKLKEKIKQSVILAAYSVKKRDCEPGYTNIAIMGTYFTYVVSHLFNIPELEQYAGKRFNIFYDYTKQQKGFTEYNSPTYTVVALDELNRMQRHIVAPDVKKKVDELYEMGWEMIARHWHQPSAQWTGPHSRSYSTLIDTSFYDLLKKASNGKINLSDGKSRVDVKSTHYIPKHLLPYFLAPKYPRVEKDLFECNEPQINGYCYLTEDYAFSTASRSSMWNQRRPITAYWGTIERPHYLQVRFLHDLYDFSTVCVQTQQRENNALAVMNFSTNGGDKHIMIDTINGIFHAGDLRLRFEVGNCKNITISKHVNDNDPLYIEAEGLKIGIQLLYGRFGSLKGHWVKGGDGNTCWLDYVFYSGLEHEFNLKEINEAVCAFAMSVGNTLEGVAIKNADCTLNKGVLKATWDGLNVEAKVKPDKKPIKINPSQWYY